MGCKRDTHWDYFLNISLRSIYPRNLCISNFNMETDLGPPAVGLRHPISRLQSQVIVIDPPLCIPNLATKSIRQARDLRVLERNLCFFIT